MELKELKNLLNQQTRFILRPDATLTVTNFHPSGKKSASINNEDLINDDENQILNKKVDGYIFGYDAKRRLKNYVISAAINKELDNKNSMFATFTFTNSLAIKEYNPKEHDDLLATTLTKFLNNLKINHGLKHYVWVAERHTGKRTKKDQKGRLSHKGWLHFHTILVFDSFFDIQLLNYLWLKRINNEKRLQCEFATLETYNSTVSRAKSNPKEFLLSITRDSITFDSSNNFAPDASACFLGNLQKAYNTNELRMAQPLAYEQNNIKAIKTLSGFLLNPVDVEFFSFGKNNERLSQAQTIRKVVSYITTYISKADNGKTIENFEGQQFEVELKIYCRIWSASRLFTGQKHKTNIEYKEALKILENKVEKVIETKIEVPDPKTGEIKQVPIYTVILNFNIYENQNYLNHFKYDNQNLLSDKSANSGLFSSELPPIMQHQTENS